ncbi:MAG: hypothetical protein ACRCZP_18075 [Phycicoccus sp.]
MATTPRKKPTPVVDASSICTGCWPNGWPDTAANASCKHGAYERPDQP